MVVTAKLMGGLANNLFQICCVLAYSLKHNCEYCIPTVIENPHSPNQKVFHSPNLKYCEYGVIKEVPMEGGYNYTANVVYKEPHFHYKEIPKYDCDVLWLNGYFQSRKYFNEYREEILKIFSIPVYPLNERYIFLHYRLGDYKKLVGFHKIISEEYINEAIIYFKSLGYKKYLVFSDDYAEARKIINSEKYNDLQFAYSEGKSEMQDLSLMASCSGGIMSASSFSWWGAWLGNQNRTIVYPKDWFGESLKHDTKDLCPENWISI